MTSLSCPENLQFRIDLLEVLFGLGFWKTFAKSTKVNNNFPNIS